MSFFQVGFKPKQYAVVLARTASAAVRKAEKVYYREGKASSVALVEDETSINHYRTDMAIAVTY